MNNLQINHEGKPYEIALFHGFIFARKASKGFNPVQLVFQHPEKAVNPRWQMHRILKESSGQKYSLYRSLVIEEFWMNRWPNELSGGELQRFCVARALTPQTMVLIADEMATMLDAITQA